MTEKLNRFAGAGLVLLFATAALAVPLDCAQAEDIVFRHVFDNSPLEVKPKPGETLTPAVLEFRNTGENPYNAKPDVVAEGKKLYTLFCQACHLPNGTGGMGASLVTDKHVYPRVKTDVGLFEVVFGGAAGAMQPFGKRLSQDEILKIMAYVRTVFIKQ
jgi:cytochrome c-L